jgi:hypothetical protein
MDGTSSSEEGVAEMSTSPTAAGTASPSFATDGTSSSEEGVAEMSTSTTPERGSGPSWHEQEQGSEKFDGVCKGL